LSKEEERKSWLLPAAGGGLLLLGIGGWLLWSKPAPAPAANTQQPVVTQPSANFDQPVATDNGGQPLSAGFTGGAAPMATEEIETALDVADKYLATGATNGNDAGRHLLDPEDDSANYWYQRVLAAQPDNVRAKKGIAALLKYYRSNARDACLKAQWVGCGIIARAGLRIDAGDPTLLALDVAAGQGERGEEAKIPPLPAE
jgi:hypothetical protein